MKYRIFAEARNGIRLGSMPYPYKQGRLKLVDPKTVIADVQAVDMGSAMDQFFTTTHQELGAGGDHFKTIEITEVAQ